MLRDVSYWVGRWAPKWSLVLIQGLTSVFLFKMEMSGYTMLHPILRQPHINFYEVWISMVNPHMALSVAQLRWDFLRIALNTCREPLKEQEINRLVKPPIAIMYIYISTQQFCWLFFLHRNLNTSSRRQNFLFQIKCNAVDRLLATLKNVPAYVPVCLYWGEYGPNIDIMYANNMTVLYNMYYYHVISSCYIMLSQHIS